METIDTDQAPPHPGPVPIHEDSAAEAGVLFDNLAASPAAGGVVLTDGVRVGIVLQDLQSDRPVFNKVGAERFGDHLPARSAIQSDQFGRKGEHARFMLEVTAYRG